MSMTNKEQELIQNRSVTWEGCSVLLDINDGDRFVFARLSAGATLKIGNENFSLRSLIGCPFGSMFHVENGSDGACLARIVSSSSEGLYLVSWKNGGRQGVTGGDIVKALISNSSTYDKKTKFSQEKYLLKKQKKFAPKVLLRRPAARSICDTYFKKYASKIGYLRIDTLSLLLSMANITSNSDVLVVDMVNGILTGAVAERLGGTGYVCNASMGDKQHNMDIVRIFNFSDETCRRIVRCSLTDLCLTQNGNSDEISKHEDNNVTENKPIEQEPSPSSLPVSMEGISVSLEHGIENPVVDTKTGSQINKQAKSAKAGDKASQELLKQWRENGFSSLIIAAPEQDAWSIVKEVFPLLSYSGPFVIYHQYLQPLATCMHKLLQEKMAICLQISEPWFREYQVLPSRTHPCMQMSASGGYILTGTKICSSEIYPQIAAISVGRNIASVAVGIGIPVFYESQINNAATRENDQPCFPCNGTGTRGSRYKR